ncbi:MAG: hypothetical protein ABII18_09180 [bacterium]|nr:hypothetical protein [bacterium]MBU1916938.1 hypothetical protein [bacterium]
MTHKLKFDKLLIAALKPEWSFLKQDFTIKQTAQHNNLYQITDFSDTYLLQTGSGMANAQSSLQNLMTHFIPSSVLHFGTAGSLDAKIKPEDLFLPHDIRHNAETLSIDSNLLSQITSFLNEQEITHHEGTLLTVKEALINQDQKQAAAKQEQAHAVDMESFILAKLCQEKGIAYHSVRAIFDSIEDDIENLGQPYDNKGDVKATKLVTNLVKSPKLIIQLPALQKRHQRICQKLRKVIHFYLRTSV